MRLHRKPQGTLGQVHHITPEGAGWTYVGFDLHRLSPGDHVAMPTGEREVILVLIEGNAEISCGAQDFGMLGDRMNVFERKPPHAVYIPPGETWSVRAETECTLAACSAPGKGRHPARVLERPALVPRGKGANTRYIFPIAMEEADVADSLLVTEVFTPSGHWSSYPPHRHDEDTPPEMTRLEETYYHRLNPARGFGVQRVFTEDGTLDETIAFSDGDVVLVPKGHHPCAAPYGFDLYYLNVMAGPVRQWRYKNHPDFDWIAQRDSA